MLPAEFSWRNKFVYILHGNVTSVTANLNISQTAEHFVKKRRHTCDIVSDVSTIGSTREGALKN